MVSWILDLLVDFVSFPTNSEPQLLSPLGYPLGVLQRKIRLSYSKGYVSKGEWGFSYWQSYFVLKRVLVSEQQAQQKLPKSPLEPWQAANNWGYNPWPRYKPPTKLPTGVCNKNHPKVFPSKRGDTFCYHLHREQRLVIADTGSNRLNTWRSDSAGSGSAPADLWRGISRFLHSAP